MKFETIEYIKNSLQRDRRMMASNYQTIKDGLKERYGTDWLDAEVWGNAKVWGNAEVCGDARLFKAEHLLVIGAIGSRNDFTTFFRNKDNEISVRCGCFLGKITDFLNKVSETHADNKHAVVYTPSRQTF